MSRFTDFIDARSVALTEGSIYERLRRNPTVAFDPDLCHGGLIYTPKDREALADLHRAYLAASGNFSILLFTDTWRANAERIAKSAYAGRPVNRDNVAFLRQLAAPNGDRVFLGGLLGCRGDAYKPREALNAAEAETFHSPQIRGLIEGGVDFLFAATLPAFSEALGLARAMASHPALISFVIRPQGTLLDGMDLAEAILRIDDVAPPLGYGINCVHPKVLTPALARLERTHPDLLGRLVTFQANTSALSPEALNAIATLQIEAPDRFAQEVTMVGRRFAIPILGGCCGTDERHIAALAKAIASDKKNL